MKYFLWWSDQRAEWPEGHKAERRAGVLRSMFHGVFGKLDGQI